MKVRPTSGGGSTEMPYSLSNVAALVLPPLGLDRARSDRERRTLVERFLMNGAMSGSDPVGEVVMSRWMGYEETRFTATPRPLRTLREGLKTIARTFFAAVNPMHTVMALANIGAPRILAA